MAEKSTGSPSSLKKSVAIGMNVASLGLAAANTYSVVKNLEPADRPGQIPTSSLVANVLGVETAYDPHAAPLTYRDNLSSGDATVVRIPDGSESERKWHTPDTLREEIAAKVDQMTCILVIGGITLGNSIFLLSTLRRGRRKDEGDSKKASE